MHFPWIKGDRAKIVRPTHDGLGADQIGTVFDVKRVSNRFGAILLLWRDEPGKWNQRRGHYAYRCKPVFRVPAVTRPTPETYNELRAAHGPSRYQTGSEVFHAPLPGWGPYSIPGKYEEMGN